MNPLGTMADLPLRQPVIERRVASAGVDETWGIAVETPVEIGINGAPWTVMMATPADLEDLATGLALTERVVTDIAAVQRIDVSNYLEGIVVDLTVPLHAVSESARHRRSLEGRIGCGLCGVEALSGLPSRSSVAAGNRVAIDEAAVRRAFAELSALQPLNLATHSVHAAAWCRVDGGIDLVREDVGRHNALDKLIGARVRAGQLDAPGFIAMTSRCSFELVYKAAATRASALTTISAPTSLALEWSATLHLPLMCRGAGDSIVAFAPGT
jgi:FdhD protein